MRYSIDHVLEGIQLQRTAQLEKNSLQLSTRALELQALKERRTDAPRRLADLLRAQATLVDQLPTVGRDEYQAVQSVITKLERTTPNQYDVGNLTSKIERLQADHAELAKVHDAGDTTLEQFLRALQAGGETHVSQYGLKQAGFNGEPLTRYIVARLQAHAETPNG